MFPAREANFEQVTYRSLERPPDSPGCRIQCPGVGFARPLRRKYFSTIFGFFSSGSFIAFHIWGGPISKSPRVFIYHWSSNFVEKVALERERWRLRIYFMSCHLPFALYILLNGG